MRIGHFAQLVFISSLWGSSFILMRIITPVLGPVGLTTARSILAAGALLLYMRMAGIPLRLERHWKDYAIIGFCGVGLGFLSNCVAALYVPAAYIAVLNATSPLWAAVMAALMLGERLHAGQFVGLIAGLTGVAILVGIGPIALTPQVILGCLAALGAALTASLAGIFTKKVAHGMDAIALTTGTIMAAGILTLPLNAAFPPPALPGPQILVLLVILALFSSALATVIYTRLIFTIGPTKAMTAAFLNPLFSILMGWLILGEPVGLGTWLGCALVLGAAWLVLRIGR